MSQRLKETMMGNPGCSKDIPEELSRQGSTENQHSQGLTIYLPREKVRNRVTRSGRLLHDLYTPHFYVIHSSRRTFYLRIEEIRVLGQGYILFRHKFNTTIKRIKFKTIVRGTKLYLLIPCDFDFEGAINADQYLVFLEIIPSKTSLVKLYHTTNSNTRSLKTIGTYNRKINEIQKPIDSMTSPTSYLLQN